jgi:hypothetical protein
MSFLSVDLVIASRLIGAALAACMLQLTGCAGMPRTTGSEPALDLLLTRTSPNKQFVITLVPPSDAIQLQQFHTWQIRVATPNGEPLTNALVYLNAGMPEHGHGLPTRPAVTKEIAPGTYLVEGVKFNMSGWWEIYVAVQKVPASDVTTFNYILALPSGGS